MFKGLQDRHTTVQLSAAIMYLTFLWFCRKVLLTCSCHKLCKKKLWVLWLRLDYEEACVVIIDLSPVYSDIYNCNTWCSRQTVDMLHHKKATYFYWKGKNKVVQVLDFCVWHLACDFIKLALVGRWFTGLL